jgi:hypothetical protein
MDAQFAKLQHIVPQPWFYISFLVFSTQLLASFYQVNCSNNVTLSLSLLNTHLVYLLAGNGAFTTAQGTRR